MSEAPEIDWAQHREVARALAVIYEARAHVLDGRKGRDGHAAALNAFNREYQMVKTYGWAVVARDEQMLSLVWPLVIFGGESPTE